MRPDEVYMYKYLKEMKVKKKIEMKIQMSVLFKFNTI